MPIFCLSLLISQSLLVMLFPSNHTSPPVGSSRRLRHRKNVDFPEPDGPITTTFFTDVQTRFNLLAEDLDILKEKLPGTEDLDAMQEQLDLHYAMLKKHTREISDLKKAN